MPSASHLLTPTEAAALARCSVRTVRRAYQAGNLRAHRRRGSRAVLLAHGDVLDWALAEAVKPPTTLPPLAAKTANKRHADQKSLRAPKLGSHRRFDLSVSALEARRAASAA